MWVYFIFKVCQYEINDFYIKNFKNFFIQYWFRRETGFLLPLLKFLSLNWFGRETGFLLTLLYNAYNAEVSDITILWFFKNLSTWQQLAIKKTN